MPRKAKLFISSDGSPVRGFLKLRANVTPRWIANARFSRKSKEPQLLQALQRLKTLQKRRPRAKAAIQNARKDLRLALKAWELAYQKEGFYRGVRILLELNRNGSTKL
jgi:hypothetical protein